MRFRYAKIGLPQHSAFFGSSILRPIIPLVVVSGSRDTAYTALVDSGADFCIFDAEVGEYLGLDIRSGHLEKFAGVEQSEGSEAFFHEVTLDVGGWKYPTAVGFSYDIAPHGYGILGQVGFFDVFMVKFDLAKEEIELKERNK